MNLLKETLEILNASDKSVADVRWVGERNPEAKTPEPSPCGTWADFERLADFEYDAGYGGAEVNGSLVIVGDDWWLERGEYDGSEWWDQDGSPPPVHHRCFRYPPVQLFNGEEPETQWPWTAPTDRCGEHSMLRGPKENIDY